MTEKHQKAPPSPRSMTVDSTCRSSKVYQGHDRYRRKYLNEIWALINGTDYLISFADSSEAYEYISKNSKKHPINGVPVIELTPEELEELRQKSPKTPILRYKFVDVSDKIATSGTLYERYEASRWINMNKRKMTIEAETDDINLRTKKRFSLPGMYKLKNGHIGPESEGNENGEFDDQNDSELNGQDGQDASHQNDQYNGQNNGENDAHQNNGENDTHQNNGENDAHQNNGENDTHQNNGENDSHQNNGENDSHQNNGENDSHQNYGQNKSCENDDQNNSRQNDGQNNQYGVNKVCVVSTEDDDEVFKNQDIIHRGASLDDIHQDMPIIERDIHLDLEYPPGFGPNHLGIDAFNLQQEAYLDYVTSSDDGDERQSNCGLGPDGTAEVLLQISLKDFLPAVNHIYSGDFTVNTVPRAEWETIKQKGFDWILFEDLPPTTDFASLADTLRSCRIKSMIDYTNDETAKHFDGFRVRGDNVSELRQKFPQSTIICVYDHGDATYVYDNAPIENLRHRDMPGFANSVRRPANDHDRARQLHYMCTRDLYFNERSTRTAAAMLLTLPGMRVVDFSEIQLVDLVLIVLSKKAVRRGVFSFVNFTSTGHAFAWKYTRGSQHILIVANFDTRQTTTRVIIDDCPPADAKTKKVQFVDILTQTTYLRDPVEMRTKGLTVILYEYEAQIFEY